MSYEPLHEQFPEIAEKETRTLTILSEPGLPKGSYGLIEMYCNESGCDCRRVFLDVYDWKKRKSMAVIAFGWEDEEFYKKWFKYELPSPGLIAELKGPALNLASRQSKFAYAFLEFITAMLEQDSNYVDRLKRHYRTFREMIDNESHPQIQAPWPAKNSKPRKKKKSRKRHRQQ